MDETFLRELFTLLRTTFPEHGHRHALYHDPETDDMVIGVWVDSDHIVQMHLLDSSCYQCSVPELVVKIKEALIKGGFVRQEPPKTPPILRIVK
jgi:hypothetical protein